MEVQRIEIEGAVQLSKNELEEIILPFQGRCLTLADINELMRTISQAYVDKGYVAARPYLPQQDMRDGVLRLVIVEGKVDAVEPQQGSGLTIQEMLFAFPGVVGQPLNLRDIEQGLDQINRLRSNRATMTLEPGDNQGATKVMVKNDPDKRWRASAGFNDGGQSSTGRHKWQVGGEVDDLLGANEFLSLTADRSAVYDRNWRASRSLNGFFSVPMGYWTFSLSASYSDYSAPVLSTTQVYHSTGNSQTRKAELERVVWRDGDSKTTAKAVLRTYSANAYVNDQKLDNSSYGLTIGGLGLGHSRRLFGGFLSMTALWERGFDLLHADGDAPGLAKDSPHAQFDKLSADLSYQHPIEIAGVALNYSASAHGQWSESTLYSAERISLGSLYSVRGFDAEYVSGDIGLYTRNELSAKLPETGQAWLDQGLGRISPFVAFDYGALRSDSRDNTERGALAGWATGIRTSGGHVLASFTYAQALTAPSFIRKRDHEVYLSLTVEY
ncbi:MAG: ShlB/FhaC/HecB family hemolysin secretion/activation protein [Magnetospirillum gryphiswaldense]|nr:ShlB/FhaC/HecB family hemolysin secretion/activation protein [Magnetospirillum gryphiswaldense]